MNRRFDDTMFWKIVKAWPIILSVFVIISTIIIMQTTIQAHTDSLRESKADRADLRMRITRVEAAIELLPEMRNDIKTLLRNGRHRE